MRQVVELIFFQSGTIAPVSNCTYTESVIVKMSYKMSSPK